MKDEEKIEFFQKILIQWYKSFGRNFPWRRKSATNYEKIISEVLLQRTKAETVAKFFPKFLKMYPSWKKLGQATETELQEALRPIGLYKQRGRRLHKLAQEMKRRKGRFPRQRSVVEEMPMMGQYIANAFELFILKKASPLLDVNMARVLERFFGPWKLADIRYDPYLQELSKKVVEYDSPIQINWAILDFSSLICTKNKPNCSICLLNTKCQAFRSFV